MARVLRTCIVSRQPSLILIPTLLLPTATELIRRPDTIGGGGFGRGTVFALNTNGTGFTALHSFAGYDGAYAREELSLSGNTLYGTAQTGGNFGGGTVFALNTNGTGFTTLHSFNYGSSDGSEPYSGVTLFGNTLYGTTRGYGGSYGAGTVFSLSFTPQLTITPSGANVILSWPTNVAGFDYTAFTLQSTTNLTPAAWSPVAQAALTNAGQVSIDVPTSGGRKFFRLNSQLGTLSAFLKTFSSSQKMSYCGLVAPAYTGHLNPITVLGHELRPRRHRIGVITPPPAGAKEKSAGLAFLPVWASSYRSRSLPLPRCGRQCSVC